MIPVLKPKLPTAEKILPYIEQIDANRWYGNFGPLVLAYEARLAELFGLKPEHVTMVANGTLGLTVALQALEVARGSLCIMPSWTFTATPAAALAAGLTPCFLDVEAETQALSPERVKVALKTITQPVGAVIAVSPFGAPIDVQAWDRFTEETGIPAIIDGAAAFDAMNGALMKAGRTPIMVSLHATKAFGIGEGGVMITKSPDTMFRLRKIINFGFESDRLSYRIAINAKPSEYNAAVGLAVLDGWQEIRAAWTRVREHYRRALGLAGISTWLDPQWMSSVCNIIVPGMAVPLAARLREQGVDTRRWWETGCHVHPAYRHCPVHGALEVTQWLGQAMLGIPAAVDLSDAVLNEVCEKVIAGVEAERRERAQQDATSSNQRAAKAVDAEAIAIIEQAKRVI